MPPPLTRRQLRLRHGNAHALHHAAVTRKRRRHARHLHPCGGDPNAFAHTPYGLPWSAQSCWMDSSLMAMFYPDEMYNVLYPLFARNTDPKVAHIKSTLLQIVQEIRAPNGSPELHGLRSMLAQETPMKGDQKYAFQVESELGYVFYFLQEIQKLFGLPCARGRPRFYKRRKSLYVLEMEQCHGKHNTVESCLNRTYRRWRFDHTPDVRHMMIELLDEEGKYSVQPQEVVRFQGYRWHLCSMVVFDCSHFVSYVKQAGQWYLYDDTRSLSHQELQPFAFNTHYEKGSCRFRYGVENTFFFYVRGESLRGLQKQA